MVIGAQVKLKRENDIYFEMRSEVEDETDIQIWNIIRLYTWDVLGDQGGGEIGVNIDRTKLWI